MAAPFSRTASAPRRKRGFVRCGCFSEAIAWERAGKVIVLTGIPRARRRFVDRSSEIDSVSDCIVDEEMKMTW